MQDKYSLAYAVAKEGWGVLANEGPQDTSPMSAGALVPEPLNGNSASFSGADLALTNVSLGLNQLAWSAALLRDRFDTLDAALSRPESVETQSLKGEQHAGQPDTVDSQRSIQIKREEYVESEKRLSTTLEPAQNRLESPWLSVKTFTLDTTNDVASSSPLAADAVKTVVDIGKPMVSGLLDGIVDTLKTRASEKIVDTTIAKVPILGKLFAGDSKGEGCCCPAQSKLEPLGSNPAADGQKETEKTGSAKAKKSGKKGKGGSQKPTPAPTPAPVPAKKAGALSRLIGGAANYAGKALGSPKVGFNAQPSAQALGMRTPPVPTFNMPGIPPAGLTGALSKLESAGGRVLGPLRSADTAINIVQGVRNGDVPAIATGLTTAGGAWAGASAGAALGTLVFPGVGTAIGGAIGGLAGSEAGAWLGEKLFGSSDRLSSPEAVSQELNSARSDNVQITVAPSIQITGINPTDAQQVVEQVIQAMQTQCVPMMTDSLGIRRNAALADQRGD